ncbi:hypothetical protein CcrBL47_gp352 [Caulobacter phage BL47]|nr:hypothetical protein CcrBL47_gp352 [Caulobacter phage BL47]
MTDKTLPPPPHVAEDDQFEELARVWVRRDAAPADGESQISLGVTLSDRASFHEVMGLLSAVATGYIIQQPEVAAASGEIKDYLIAQGTQQLLEQTVEAASPLRPQHLPAPDELLYEPGSVNIASLWIDPTQEGTHTIFAGEPQKLGAKTLGGLLATMLLEAGRNADGTFNVDFIEGLQTSIATTTKAYLAQEGQPTQ